MKKPFLFIGICLLLLTGTGFAGDHAGMIKTTQGTVDIHRAGRIIQAAKGTLIEQKDVLFTKADSYAGIMFSDGTMITIGPDTEFKIDTYLFAPDDNAYDFSFFLAKGSAVYESGKIAKLSPESVKIATPRATVGIRGTRFLINVD